MRILLSFFIPAVLCGQAPAWIRQEASKLQPQVVEWRRDFHAHPELSNREVRTGAKVEAILKSFGIETRRIAGHGVVGVLKGALPGPAVALREDMDALPIQEVADVPWRSTNPGVMHACGHDAHSAMLLGAAKLLAAHKAELRGTIVFLFQPAEEGAPVNEEGGARRMIAEGALEHPKVEAIYGMHQLPEAPIGTLGWRSGPVMAGSDTWHLTLHGVMSHGAAPHRGNDTILMAAEAIQALQAIRSRRINPVKPFVFTVGTIHGGNRHNIIADKVEMSGTMRTFEPAVRERAIALIHDTLKGVCAIHGGSYEFKLDADSNPPVDNDPRLAAAVRPLLANLGKVVDQALIMGAEDFAHYQRKIPGYFLFLGTGNPAKGSLSGNHTPTMNLDEDALQTGVAALAAMAWGHPDIRP
ncbi:MAG: amidohydrolase [Holophagaceae bacterium]|nr:amidohydrolase [Holophagaceae bacterium]